MFCFHRLQCGHGIGKPVSQIALKEEQHQGDADDNDTECSRKMVIRTHLTHKLAVHQYRKCLITFADQHGGTKIGEHSHKYQ